MDQEAVANEIRSRLAANDPAAMEMIWTEYASDLLGYLAGIHCSRSDAEDSLQEVFVTIARKRAAVAGARQLRPYLFQLARNVALNRRKQMKRIRDRAEPMSDWLVPVAPDAPDEDRIQTLVEGLAELPEKQRSVLVLKFYRDKTLREIGTLLGISENTAASCFRYGIEKLRRMVTEGRNEEIHGARSTHHQGVG
ncbi:MAG: sigma-70 family RNA polymerase sigma factor [Acidobacteria bacterium]|nr:sigma-70 family RNA polymerase sigma factor [Acidobacteriota bacterium]